jgi:hypothetical protein
MTADEAHRLKVGDRVHLIRHADITGTVVTTFRKYIYINWDDGTAGIFHHDTIAHITRYLEKPHDR